MHKMAASSRDSFTDEKLKLNFLVNDGPKDEPCVFIGLKDPTRGHCWWFLAQTHLTLLSNVFTAAVRADREEQKIRGA